MLIALEQVRIVLVEPTHPGNIGAVARALKTMGLTRLVLVKPKKYPHYEASKRSAGAENVLDSAVVVETVEQAVADCTMVLGTSVREREVSWPTADPRASASAAMAHLNDDETAGRDAKRQVAILFGRESSGLTNSEMDLCESQIRIPANDEYSSLNLASAVQIVAYELRMQCIVGVDASSAQSSLKSGETGKQTRQQRATKQQCDGHLLHLQNVLASLDFSKSKTPTVLMRKLTRLYNKAELTVEEIQILRGILSAIESQLDITEKN